MAGNRKSERLEIRLTPEEKQKISYNAQLMGISKAEYISLCLRRKRIVVCKDFPDLIYHLYKIGNNINQIATVANTNKQISQDSINEVHSLMMSCYGKLTEFVSYITEPESSLNSATDRMPEMIEEIYNILQTKYKTEQG